jgi:hypothetical protein
VSPTQPAVNFSLAEIHSAAHRLLHVQPDPIPAYRLLHEVLRLPSADGRLQNARAVAEHSKWVQQLSEAQLADGSWGRFHSQDTRLKSVFRTSEEAIDRAFSLGLESSHPVLARAVDYIESVLTGQAYLTDRAEKNESWPLVIRLILSGRLAHIQPANPILNDAWGCLVRVAQQAFSSGKYCLDDEADAFVMLTNTYVPKCFLESQHALWILSSRPLEARLEMHLVNWIWNKPDGIRYLRAPLAGFQARQIAYWLRSMNILSRFPSWRYTCGEALSQLWSQRDELGYWDFGRQISGCVDLPLSENWKNSVKRQVDYSTFMLVLLRRFFD